MPVLKSWLTALKYCQRLQQGSEQPCIYVACNEPDLQDTQQLLDSIQDMKGEPSNVAACLQHLCFYILLGTVGLAVGDERVQR